MRRCAVSTFQRWQFRDGRPNWSARVLSHLLGVAFAAGIGPNQAATLEVRGRKTGRKISFPVVVVAYEADRYLVAMLGDKANWVRNLRADNHAVLLQGRRESVSLVEEFSGNRAAILRRYLELAPGARPFFPIDRRAPLSDFEGIVEEYPVFRVAPAAGH
jgi:F420H(2)-dependent quinone reductase